MTDNAKNFYAAVVVFIASFCCGTLTTITLRVLTLNHFWSWASLIWFVAIVGMLLFSGLSVYYGRSTNER